MKLAIISITAKGAELAFRLGKCLDEKHDIERFAYFKNPIEGAEIYENLSALITHIFAEYDGLIFVCACGIAVRSLARCIRSKQTDPAVVVIDDSGKFAISLLSGHIGKANALTELIAKYIEAVPVITTATDSGKKFSPDSFALANNLHICSMSMAKAIASEALNGRKIGLVSDYMCINVPKQIVQNEPCEYGICISKDSQKQYFKHTLNLVPKDIIIGAGCRKNIDSESFEKIILERLIESNISVGCVRILATIDIKKNEKAMLDFCRKYKIEFVTFTAEQLMAESGEFEKSEFVMRHTGSDNVCERSAVAAGGEIILKKKSGGGVTFAAALIKNADIYIDFERACL